MGHESECAVGWAWPALNGLVDEVLATRRRVAAAQAAEARLLSRAVDIVTERIEERRARRDVDGPPLRDGGADLPLREVSLELGMAIRVSDRTLQARMGQAWTLVQRFPATLAEWESGAIDAGHAWAIVQSGTVIDDDTRRARYERLALDAAATESPARFAAAARAIAAAVDPESCAMDIAAARAERRVRLYPLQDGLARLIADLPAPLAHAIYDRLTHIATAPEPGGMPGTPPTSAAAGVSGVPDPSGPLPDDATSPEPADPRTVDQLRADTFSELLLTGTPSAHDGGLSSVAGRVQVTIPILTLAAGGEEPALLAGYGPIDPAIARRLAARAPGWDRVFTDAYTGLPLAVDRYRPNAQLIRYLDARDERCRTPTCTVPAHRCDKDHTVDAAKGGPTEAGNLAGFCRRHHVDKHHTAWRVTQLGGGVLEWTSPTGRTYRDRPPATVRFVPSVEEPLPVDPFGTHSPDSVGNASNASTANSPGHADVAALAVPPF